MTDTTRFSSAAPLGARIGAICLVMPVVAIAVIVLLGAPPRPGELALALVSLALAFIVVFAALWKASAVLTISEREVALGFWPLWVTRVPIDDMADVSVVTVDPYAQYRGWGIKGSAGTELGRLYSAGGTHATRIRTSSHTTYLVAFTELSTAQRAAAELSAVCVSSAESSRNDSGQ
ncbi:hypothetical protein [Mycetocola reblochoni]|uniref:Uncharacterized protein n=2 Tax=Mycetocola reblochoni TaxID=331618 RepID=A0A1R4K6W8_9MICO|nr:hypothetical protein [Mycetocola reblochoni]RLP67977.1 hypothetical protein D9V30_11765 [Mycetocola reblochoni]SJN39954.1 hypothetical protein FM119_11735 [Mycetocola reblochoni REB411]